MIVLVDMPFGSITKPPLAPGLIRAQLAEIGAPCRVVHASFALAQAIGFGRYETIARFKGHGAQIGEWLFSEACWRRDFGPSEDEFLRDLCGDELALIPALDDRVAFLCRARADVVPAFLERTYERVVEHGVPDVVAFSCMFFQTIASLALGRILKERHPAIRLAYGGACFHDEMGEELFRAAPWIDAVSTGEADAVIAPLFEALLRGEPPRGLAGILARDRSGDVIAGPPPRSTTAAELDQLPDPMFDEFFATAAEVGLLDDPAWRERAAIPFEASRGCWWGQKQHCTFCGLNAAGLGYREKSPARALATLRNLAARYPVGHMHATDNILSMQHMRAILPALHEEPLQSTAAGGEPVRLFFEVKANLSRAQVGALHAAGITQIQPGIESLSSALLARMKKGVTALQNVYLLKCCAEYGVVPMWSLLLRVPGETRADYDHMERWLPLLFHLRPPGGGAPRIECHRFSPYFARGAAPGGNDYVEDVRPAPWYRGLYPADRVDLAKVAYYFDATWKDTLGDPAYDRVLELVAAWRARWLVAGDGPRLTLRDRGELVEIEDTRGGELVTWTLTGHHAVLVRRLADPIAPRQLARDAELAEADVRAALHELVELGLAVHEGDRFLGLALAPCAPQIPTETRRVEMGRVANQEPTGARRLPVLWS